MAGGKLTRVPRSVTVAIRLILVRKRGTVVAGVRYPVVVSVLPVIHPRAPIHVSANPVPILVVGHVERAWVTCVSRAVPIRIQLVRIRSDHAIVADISGAIRIPILLKRI
jgi:hypothetical protein